MRKEFTVNEGMKAILQGTAIALIDKVRTGIPREEAFEMALKGDFRITLKDGNTVVLETGSFDETGTPEHPYSVGELESAVRSVVDFEAGEGEQGLENLEWMGISEEMAAFFGWPKEEEEEDW